MLLVELIDKKEIWYHGSPALINTFNLENVGSKDATDLHGPGIYLTSSIEDALIYGTNVYTVTLLRQPRLVPDTKNFTTSLIKNLIDLSPNKNEILTDWDENKKIAISKAVNAIYDKWGPNQFREMLEQIWYEFYRDVSKEWLMILVNELKYDGFIIRKTNGIKHFICFNPEILKIVEVQKL